MTKSKPLITTSPPPTSRFFNKDLLDIYMPYKKRIALAYKLLETSKMDKNSKRYKQTIERLQSNERKIKEEELISKKKI